MLRYHAVKTLVWPLALTMLTGLGACSSGAGAARQPDSSGLAIAAPLAAPLAFTLPAVAALPLAGTRAGSYVESDLIQEGADFQAGLVHSNTVVNGDFATFSPQGGSGFDGLAYCIWHFTAADYDRNPEIRLSRSINPASYADSFVALANLDSQRWDVYPDDPDGKVNLADLSPYFSAGGDLYVAVLETGTAASEVSMIRLGGPAPLAAISASPDHGAPPLATTLDAAASSTVEGSITRYEWDPEGDGIFEIDGGGTPTLDFEYAAEGDYNAAVRVTNSLGNTALGSTLVKVSSTFVHTFGLGSTELLYAAARDAESNLYLAGSATDPLDPGVNSMLLIKLDPSGDVVWARRCECGDSANLTALELSPDNTLILGGHTELAGDTDALVQAWDLDGNQLWSMAYGATDDEQVSSLAVTPAAIYVGGTVISPAAIDPILVRMDHDGNVIWSRERDIAGHSEYCRTVTMKRTGDTVDGVIMGNADVSGSDSAFWMLEYKPNGDLLSGRMFDDPSLLTDITQIMYVRPDSSTDGIYYLGGAVNVSGDQHPFVLAMPDSGASLFGRHIDGVSSEAAGLAFDSQGNLTLLAYTVGVTGNVRAILASFDSSAGSLLQAQRSRTAAAIIPQKLITTPQGLLVCGAAKELGAGWTDYSPGEGALSAAWTDVFGLSTSPSYTSAARLSTVSDVTAQLVLDQNDPDFEAYAELRDEL